MKFDCLFALRLNMVIIGSSLHRMHINAPNNFNISIDKKNIEAQDVNIIDYANSGNIDADPGKLSLTILNKESSISLERNVVSLNFCITVPPPLKVWFLSIYDIAIAILIMLCITVGNEIWLYFGRPYLILKGQ